MLLNYSVSFPGSCGCGQSSCNSCSSCNSSYQGVYTANTCNTAPQTTSTCGHQQACNGCVDITKAECIQYTGSNLTSTGINKYDDLNIILQKLDALKAIQDAKNANILAALNNLNTRLNALEPGADHAPYTLL